MTKKVPKCPSCKTPLNEVYEFGSFRKNWSWNHKKQLYEGSKERWLDDVTTHCGVCGEEIDNTFLLDNVDVEEPIP